MAQSCCRLCGQPLKLTNPSTLAVAKAFKRNFAIVNFLDGHTDTAYRGICEAMGSATALTDVVHKFRDSRLTVVLLTNN